ncbi:MAG: site-specific DNA-methyltransferase [Ruminococcus flavefaciens]|nr:site-specific DNA-methyltransferase [Ruminococcus flavefaciens]
MNDFTNRIYQMDNLELLCSLTDESFDLIYCDILYNTGKRFDDFDDNLGNKDEAVQWYHPRFIEMKRVLKDTGLLYIHCDYNLSHYIKVELDKIFGEDNFRNEIIWWYNSAPRKKKDFGKRHDAIFRYSKSDNYYFNTDSKYIRQEYSPTAPRGYEKEKYYDERGKIMDDVWRVNMLGQNDKTERVGYSTQKPKELLYKIIDSSCPKGGIVADFFCGSGTTCVVAKELGRNFLGCDINEKAVTITKERLGNV